MEVYMPLRTLICGGRAYNDINTFYDVLNKFDIEEIITGCANGADKMAREFAIHRNIPLDVHKAKWKVHGRAAGPIRNTQMILQKPDLVLAFPGGKGTRNMITQANSHNIFVYKINGE